MKVTQDLFGRLCKTYLDCDESSELKLQLDNGVIMDDFPIPFYADSTELRPLEAAYLQRRGKVLDIGCGTGRIGLVLRGKAKWTGVDSSPSMVGICKQRGLEAYHMDVNEQLPEGPFDAVVMYGNGFGMPGTVGNIKSLLRRLRSATSSNAILVAESNDPNRMTNQIDLKYQERNKMLGRYVGQRKWRYLSGDKVSAYINWVQVEPRILEQIANETNWKITSGPEYEVGSQWGAYFFELSKR